MLSVEHIICELVEDSLFGGRDLGSGHDEPRGASHAG
jgi:hypothetical protein